MKHTNEEELFAYREGEMKGRAAIAAHLQECGECRAELERVEAVFQALNAMPVPDPGEDYGAKVWRQIAGRLPEKHMSWWSGFFVPRRLMALGAAAALLIVAFLAGRYTGPNKSGGDEEIADASKVRERVLVVAVGEHLGKSEMILMELSNTQPENGKKLINISSEQKRAEDLVEENRLYRQTAMSNGDNGMVSTLDELERVLLDVANSPDEVTPAQFESIQKRIAAQGILLKVRVVRQELRTEAKEHSTAPAQNDSTAKARNKV